MKEEILNVEKNDRREYVSLSVKVVDIHLSDCINTSPQSVYVEEGGVHNINFIGGQDNPTNFGTWQNPNHND